MIKTENIIYKYPGQEAEGTYALKDINIEINKGEFVAVLGHNGSGKSTFAKHLNALLLPSSGTVYVSGIDTKDGEHIWEIRQSAGMVFQNPDNQIVATIVEEDVAFGPENLGVPTREIRKRVDESLMTVDMFEHRMHSPHLLSGGQKQRVAIAGILAMKPRCIVLDEPTAMLDPSGRKEVMETIMKLNKEDNITIVLITHYMDEAVNADRIYIMENGKVAIEGTPKEVFSKVEEIKAIGLDVPQVTELAKMLADEGIAIPIDILTVDEMVVELCRLR